MTNLLLFTWTWAFVSVLEMTYLPNVSVLGNLRICLLFTWSSAGVSVLEIRNFLLVHLDLGLCVCIGNGKSSSCSPGPSAGLSVLEMSNLPLVRLDLGLCVYIGNGESSSCSPGPWLVYLHWKLRIFLLFTWTCAGVSVLEMTNLPLVHLDLGCCVCI